MRSFRAPRTPHAAARPGAALLLTITLLATSVLAGCLADGATPPTPGTGDDTTAPAVDPSVLVTANDKVRDLRTDLKATDSVPAPTWTAGDLFGQHVFFGSDDSEGIHFDAVVYETADGVARLGTPSEGAALEHALVQIPMLGDIDVVDLSSAGLGGLWRIYDFPLSDGKTWQGEIPNIAFDVIDDDRVPLTFTARYESSIETLSGTFPGFLIEGRTADGILLVETDYLPEIRWYNRLLVHDIDPNQDPLEFEVRSMGHGRGWTGDLVDIQAEGLFGTYDALGFSAPPWDGGEPYAAPAPHGTFSVGPGYDELYLYGWTFAVIGVKEATMVAPDGSTFEWRASSAGMEDSWDIRSERIAPIEGEWQWATTGAGGFVQAGGYAAGLTIGTITLA